VISVRLHKFGEAWGIADPGPFCLKGENFLGKRTSPMKSCRSIPGGASPNRLVAPPIRKEATLGLPNLTDHFRFLHARLYE
jgi:hypothetical protein